MSETSETIPHIDHLPYLKDLSPASMREFSAGCDRLISQLRTTCDRLGERIERMKNNSP